MTKRGDIALKKIMIFLVMTMLMTAPAASASEWICRCGCGDRACINIDGDCYAGNNDWSLYEFGDTSYEDVDNENGTITHTYDGLIVDNKKKNHSWGYYFEIPERSRHYLHWDARLDVLEIEGGASAGITIEGLGRGATFKVNRFGMAKLAFIVTNKSSDVVDWFFLPKEIRSVTKGEFTLGLEYDVRTSLLVAKIDDKPVKTVALPYFGIPPFASVVGFSIQTTNQAHTSIGRVTYGDFSAYSSNDFFENTLQ